MGDPTGIVYRSSFELRMMQWLDTHPEIVKWSSENIAISYVSPVDGRYHRYFPDMFVRKKDADGKLQSLIVEIKPKVQTIPPQLVEGTKKSRRYMKEVMTWAINSAKWEAAQRYCEERKWTFVVMHEDHLFGKNKIT